MGVLTEWLELGVRWVHVIAGVAWIGTSFYFNWLNDRLEPPASAEGGEVGELWSVHGGAFYRAVKYDRVPRATLDRLHWFKWEAYLTWLSGFALLALVYYLGAEVYLVEAGSAISPGLAVAVGIGALAVGWIVYDRLCRSPLAARPAWFAAVGLSLVALAAFGLDRVFGGRAAYIHVGAMLGSIMAFNVFAVIIPAHVELVRGVEEQRRPDPTIGAHAAMRSRHNNYLTLPVIFAMISNHYPSAYGHAWGWLLLVGLFVVGVITRHGFNLRNQGLGRRAGWWFPAAGLGLLALAIVSTGTRGGEALRADAPGGAVSWARAQEILVARCVTCHAEEPAHRLFDAPPGGIRLETSEQVRGLISRIRAVTVESRVMPLGNVTGMTEEERAVLAAWIEQGAPTEP